MQEAEGEIVELRAQAISARDSFVSDMHTLKAHHSDLQHNLEEVPQSERERHTHTYTYRHIHIHTQIYHLFGGKVLCLKI